MENFDLRKYLTEGKLFEAQKGEPLNDKALLNFLQQNMDDVVYKVADRDNHTPSPKFEFDGDGDVSIQIAYPDTYGLDALEDPSEGDMYTVVYAFRKPEDVDHVGPLGISFRNEGDDDPESIKIAGKDLMYISYPLEDI